MCMHGYLAIDLVGSQSPAETRRSSTNARIYIPYLTSSAIPSLSCFRVSERDPVMSASRHAWLRPHAHIWSRCRCRPRVLASGRALALAQSLHAQAMGQTDMLGYYIAKNTSGACLCLLHALFNLAHGRSNQPLSTSGPWCRPEANGEQASPEAAYMLCYSTTYCC
jgi:hypothetical protein